MVSGLALRHPRELMNLRIPQTAQGKGEKLQTGRYPCLSAAPAQQIQLWGEAGATADTFWAPRQIVPQAFGREGLYTGEGELKSGTER